MRAPKKPKAGPQRKNKTRILKWALALTVVLIVLVVFLVPAFVSSEKGRKLILNKINNSIDGKVDFAGLSMNWTKGFKVTDFSFNDSAGLTLFKIKQIDVKPHYGSILAGSLSFGKTIIDEPKVEIKLEHPLSEKVEGPRQKTPAGKRAQPIILPIKKIDLTVNNGNVKVTDSKAKTVELSQINSKVNLRPPPRQTNFDIDMTVVDEGKGSKIHADGRISLGKAKTGWTLKGTSGNFSVQAADLNLPSLSPFFALAGVDVQAEGLLSASIIGEIKNGQIDNLSANIKGKDLDITGSELKGDRFKTGTLDVDAILKKSQKLINIQKLQIQTDWMTAHASGDVPTTFESLADFVKADSIYNLKGSFDCDLAAASSLMPHTFRLKEGTKITSGQLNGDIETLTEAGERKIYGKANLVGLAGAVEGKTITISEPVSATVEITSDESGINFDRLDVAAAFGQVNCTGTSELLNFSADVDLKKFQSELGQFADIGPYQIAGELSSKGQAAIKEGKFTATGSSNMRNVVIALEEATVSEPAANIDFSFDIDQKNNLITIDSVKASATLGQVSIRDAVLPLNKKAAKPMRLSVFASNIDLQRLQPFAVLFTSFPNKMQLAGIAESDISISSEKDTYIVKTDSTKIKNLKVRYPDQKPFESDEVSLVFDTEINPPQKTINIKKLQLESPQIKIKKGQLKQTNVADKTELEGQLDCEYDWAAVSTIAASYLPTGLHLEGRRKDSISFTSEYPIGQTDKLLANLNTKAKLGFDKANYKGLNFGVTELDIQIQNGLLNIAPFSTTVNNGRLNFAAKMDLRQKPMVLQTTVPMQIIDKVEINEQVSRNLLVYLNPIFKDQADITGIANFHSEKLVIPLGRDPNIQPEIIGTVGIEKMKLQTLGLLGEILSRAQTSRYVNAVLLPTKFVLQNGKLSYDNMPINVDVYPLNFNGSIGPRRLLDMAVITPYVLTSDFKFRTVKVDEESAAERFTIHLGGTIDKPEIDWGKIAEELLKQQIEQRLKQEIFEGLDKLLK